MTDNNNKIRAVVLAALMVLSVFAGTIAFTGTAAATLNSVSGASAGDVTANAAGTTHTVEFTTEIPASSTGNVVEIDYAAGNVTSVSTISLSDPDGGTNASDVSVSSSPSIPASGTTTFQFELDDTADADPETVTVSFDVTHDLSAVGATSGVGIDINDGAGGATDGTTTFDVVADDRPGGTITDTAYLGESGVDLRGVSGISGAAGDSATLYGVAGEADGSTASVSDITNADISEDNDFTTGGYSTASGDDTVELSVIEPRVTDATIYRGSDDSGADVTDGSILTSDDTITVEGEFNFEDAEALDITIEDEDGLEVQTQLSASPSQITTSGGDVTFTGLTDLDTGEYTVTVEGEDDLDSASRSATFSIRDEDQTINLAESTLTKGDNVVATVTGTPGQIGLVRIAQDDLDDANGTADNTNASNVFANTGDVVGINGTQDVAGYSGDEYVGAFVDLDDGGEASVRVDSNYLDTATIDVEFVETGISNANTPLTIGEVDNAFTNDSDADAELTVEDKEINITSAPSVVRIGEEFTLEGQAPESDDVKAYARIDNDYVPLEDDNGDASTDNVDSDGSFSVDIDSGQYIDLPDSYRIALVADPTDDVATATLGVTGPGNSVDSDDYSEFETTTTTTVRTVEGDLTAQLSTSAIAADVGDEVTLSGTALGQGDEVLVYIVDPRGDFLALNATDGVATIDVDEEEFEEDYAIFNRRGTYTFIIVGQGRDGQFNDGNERLDPTDLSGLSTTPQQAVALINDEYTGAGSDDQLVELTLQAQNPQLTIDDFTTDGQVAQGEVTISGTSNREDETTVFIEVLGQNDNVVASQEAEVNGSNSEWEATLDMSDVETGTYTLRADDDEASAELEFELVSELSTPTETPAPDTETETPAPDTETETPAPDTETETPAPETETTTSTSTPGFGAIVALVALIAAALLAIRRD
ncbi:surface glycoprotein [Salinigranum marinum]|uniref:beta strand repeat-containing protein n=1 Tax=Salinigranum marinum TaxID=1515595 RepID=UPI002989CAE2|nr:surface glycoprotein [Salinigranum marinum]